MKTNANTSVYKQLVDITYDYLGPAAERFVRSMCESHLGKEPEQLTRSDVTKLQDWSKLSLAMMSDDEQTADEYAESLRSIARARKSHH